MALFSVVCILPCFADGRRDDWAAGDAAGIIHRWDLVLPTQLLTTSCTALCYVARFLDWIAHVSKTVHKMYLERVKERDAHVVPCFADGGKNGRAARHAHGTRHRWDLVLPAQLLTASRNAVCCVKCFLTGLCHVLPDGGKNGRAAGHAPGTRHRWDLVLPAQLLP
jgi:hypothetical protein